MVLGNYVCDVCSRKMKSIWGLRQHKEAKHPAPIPLPPRTPPLRFPSPTSFRTPSPPPNPSSPFSSRRSPRRRKNGSPVRLSWSAAPVDLRKYGTQVFTHPIMDGTPCDIAGDDLPEGSPPSARESLEPDNYSPFNSAVEFELGEFLYQKVEMSGGDIDTLAGILSGLLGPDRDLPFTSHEELYATIDDIKQGDVPWESFSVRYNGDLPDDISTVPAWKTQSYEDKIAEDENNHGGMFVPVILGSDKTTVSVATGQNDYYPLYISLGNVFSSVRWAHRNAVALLGFLAVPKTSQDHAGGAEFRKFRRQLFHTSLEHILSSLRPFMEGTRVTLCPDGHYRRVIYGLGPYIADYPEQALLACIVQNWCARCTAPPDDLDGGGGLPRSHEHTDVLSEGEGVTLKELWDDYGIVADLRPFTTSFPRADIHELLAPDLLHQIIKGTFKDHLVEWVNEYIDITYSKSEAKERLADIDRRIMATTPFPGLRNFHEGQGFKQWTGNDSKGLMKVYLPAIVGHVPPQMVEAIADFLEFCYLVRQSVISEDTVTAIENAVARFHQSREIFRTTGVRPDGFSLPRQHSLVHYSYLIQQFGAPNGLCSSITESKHIAAVKRPWRRSSRNQPLGQMLLTNQRLDKLSAYRVDTEACGMLQPRNSAALPPPPPPPPSEAEVDAIENEAGPSNQPYSQGDVKLSKKAARNVPRCIDELGKYLEQPQLRTLLQQFLYNQLHPDLPIGQMGCDVPPNQCPQLDADHTIFLHHSARAFFFAPSDASGLGGMRHELIRSVKSWRKGPARYDCVFMEGDDGGEVGFEGLLVGRVFAFLQFKYGEVHYPCALIHWFSTAGSSSCDETGMWMVQPDFDRGENPIMEVVHIDCLYRSAHLIGITGDARVPIRDFGPHNSLDNPETFLCSQNGGLTQVLIRDWIPLPALFSVATATTCPQYSELGVAHRLWLLLFDHAKGDSNHFEALILTSREQLQAHHNSTIIIPSSQSPEPMFFSKRESPATPTRSQLCPQDDESGSVTEEDSPVRPSNRYEKELRQDIEEGYVRLEMRNKAVERLWDTPEEIDASRQFIHSMLKPAGTLPLRITVNDRSDIEQRLERLADQLLEAHIRSEILEVHLKAASVAKRNSDEKLALAERSTMLLERENATLKSELSVLQDRIRKLAGDLIGVL
ncbi:hypothetical protein D9758_005472 [Tetrapyrgos nigripes]|uniref:C2H2-type domain-containing protein n=1 Tax=Tetrapyrgos nigripes TaxID=182062 RepID=A0A8H5GI56_9AGAR|nr:hypothetical protein D9758_005472 [Tetrapyrgos nigripes]